MGLPGAPPPPKTNLTGHLGHLTQEQEDAFNQFKQRLTPDYYTPPTDSTPASHDDNTLLRFLRARKFDVEGAFGQFTNTENWRRENQIDKLYDEFDVEEFAQARAVYPQWTGRRTRAGLPLYEFKVGTLTKEVVNEYSKVGQERLDLRMAALSENMIKFTVPLASAIPHGDDNTPISATVTIVNIANVSLMRFWALRSHMQRASVLATAHYAETLGAIYIVGAPGFFSTVWGWIGKWFDPGTVEKIFILAPNEVLPVLSKYIDPSNIPKEYGGDLDWGFGAPEPSPGPEEQAMLGVERVVRGPQRFSVEKGYELLGTGRTEEEIEVGTPKKKVQVEKVTEADVVRKEPSEVKEVAEGVEGLKVE